MKYFVYATSIAFSVAGYAMMDAWGIQEWWKKALVLVVIGVSSDIWEKAKNVD